MAVIGTLIFLDKNSSGKTPVYYKVQIEQSQLVRNPIRLPPVQQHYPDGSAATILTFLPDGDRILLCPFETSQPGHHAGFLRVDPTRRKPNRVLEPFDGTTPLLIGPSLISQWSPDQEYAVFLNDFVPFDLHSGFWGWTPYLFDLRRNTLTPLPEALGGFFWHPRSHEPRYRFLICQTLYEPCRDEKGNLIKNASGGVERQQIFGLVGGRPLIPRCYRIRITEQGKPMPPEPLSGQEVDHLIGSTYRVMTEQSYRIILTKNLGGVDSVLSSIFLSPNGRTSVEYGLLKRYQDPNNPDPGFHLPDPLGDRDHWLYRIFHDGRFLRTVSVLPDQYIYPLQWTADSRYLIGQRGYTGDSYGPEEKVVLVEPLSWQVKPLYQPPGKWKLVAFQEKPVAR